MKKREFFHKPETVQEILGGKKVRHISRDIAEKTAELSENEGIIIPEIVPDDFESRLRFLKRGAQVILEVGKTQADAIYDGITPQTAHQKAMSSLKKEKYCGMVWKSLRRNEWKRATLDESIKGTKLFAWTELTGNKIEAKPYNDIQDVGFYGGKFKFRVPSRTPKNRRHELTAESVPIKRSRYNPVIWTDLTFTHYCGIVGNDFSFRYVKSEDFCAHGIAALEFLAKEEYTRGEYLAKKNRVPFDFMPFPLPTEEMVHYHNKLMSQVMVSYKDPEGKQRKRPLNKAEREILLWDFVRVNGYEPTFGPKDKKITEYAWEKAA